MSGEELFKGWGRLGYEASDMESILKGDDHCGRSEVDYFEQALRSGSVLISPLHDAAATGDVKRVAELLEAVEAKVDARDAAGNTPLLWAAACGRVAAMALLLEKGADLNAANEMLDTGLHRACWRNQTAAVKFLIDHNINENVKNKDGKLATELIRSSEVALLFTIQGRDGDIFCHTDDDSSGDGSND